jgi:murein DD-endopeptidase MepM/ murein hydrolase activator NlpD
MQENDFFSVIEKHQPYLKPVVRVSAAQKLVKLDLSTDNKNLTTGIMGDIDKLSAYVNEQISSNGGTFGIGGYLENRNLYQHSPLFDAQQKETEPRTIHLGVDIWGPAGTPVFTPLGGTVHSFAFNNHQGDYGATIILQHQLEGFVFHTLYGHLSLADLTYLRPNNFISPGICIGHFGAPAENGNWPPHLHFQVIIDMRMNVGDYPGVCAASQKASYRQNCPDPALLMPFMAF